MRVVVLNDGETFTDLRGCTILWVPDDIEGDDVDQFVQEFADSGTQLTEVYAAWERSIR